jgi:hypothetical protein
MDRLINWLLTRMAAYRSGGIPYRQAARWTYGELLAVYQGRQYRNGKRTREPDIPAGDGLKAAEAALREIRGVYDDRISLCYTK